METGARKIWVHSFAHCFAAEQLTFTNKLDADNWALVAAKSIIDRTFEQIDAYSPTQYGKAGYYRLAERDRRSLSGFGLFQDFSSVLNPTGVASTILCSLRSGRPNLLSIDDIRG